MLPQKKHFMYPSMLFEVLRGELFSCVKYKFDTNHKILRSISLLLNFGIIINSSSKQLEIMIAKLSLFFQTLLFWKIALF